MSGEGRGHATRSRAMIDLLSRTHEVTVFAPGDAWKLLAPAYEGSRICVRRIPGLRFVYTKNRRVAPTRTFLQACRFTLGLPALIGRLCMQIGRERPDLVISDFEPALPRAARLMGVPVINLDHQGFLVVNDLSMLPARLRRKAWLMKLAVGLVRTRADRTIVSSFYQPPVREQYRSLVTQVGVIIRPSLAGMAPTRRGHLVVYLRKFERGNVMTALRDCGWPVRIYGLGEREREGNLRFFPVSEEGFLRDLASCEALVTTAGNQLVGEALFLGKPVFAMPEPNNDEQAINGFFLERSGVGRSVPLEEVTTASLLDFLACLSTCRKAIQPGVYNGTDLAFGEVMDFLERLPSRIPAPPRNRWSPSR